jgi:hypothetical protein
MAIESWMRNNTKDEVALLIAENNDEVKVAAKEAHELYRDPIALMKEGFIDHDYFPLVKIRDGLQFASKSESKHLQIADVCAWAFRRLINRAPNAVRFFAPFEQQVFGVCPSFYLEG